MCDRNKRGVVPCTCSISLLIFNKRNSIGWKKIILRVIKEDYIQHSGHYYEMRSSFLKALPPYVVRDNINPPPGPLDPAGLSGWWPRVGWQLESTRVLDSKVLTSVRIERGVPLMMIHPTAQERNGQHGAPSSDSFIIELFHLWAACHRGLLWRRQVLIPFSSTPLRRRHDDIPSPDQTTMTNPVSIRLKPSVSMASNPIRCDKQIRQTQTKQKIEISPEIPILIV